jgi:hypothetical protein
MSAPNPSLTLLRKAGWAPLGAIALHWVVSVLGVREAADNLVHFCGGAAIAFFAWHACRAFAPWIGMVRPAAWHAAAFMVACTAAVFVEIFEFGSDQLLGTKVQHSLFETMMDLVSGVAGGIAALVAVAVLCRGDRTTG